MAGVREASETPVQLRYTSSGSANVGPYLPSSIATRMRDGPSRHRDGYQVTVLSARYVLVAVNLKYYK